jgi:hypothetical protein
METINPNWTSWILLLIILVGLWMLVRFLERSFPGFLRALPFPPRNILILRLMRRWMPLLILLILAWRFLLIAPLPNGIFLLLVILGSFQAIQSFFLGWVIRSRLVLYPDPWLRCGEISGRVDRFGLLGLEVVNPQGRHSLYYQLLSRKGYSLLPTGGEDTFLECLLEAEEKITGKEPGQTLRDLLALCPYTDWNHPPQIRTNHLPRNQFLLRVNLLTGRFEGPFQNLLSESGYRSIQPVADKPLTDSSSSTA